MSLLLLFPSGSAGWTIVAATPSGWTISHYDFKNIWGEWETSTWGSLASSGRTWSYMSGYTFVNTTGNSTTWTRV